MAQPQIVTIPCLADNYAYLVKPEGPEPAILIDAPEAGPIAAALAERGWDLGAILITHHHYDHVDGIEALRRQTGCTVLGAAADAHRLPPLDRALSGGDMVRIAGLNVGVIAVPGHTLGHLAYHIPQAGVVFTADSLMACGCGRLSEGTAEQMHESLSRLAALTPDTLIYSGHEYTTSNLRFALTLDPQNPALISRQEQVAALREQGLPSVPVMLSEELATNPFLRAGTVELRAAVGVVDAPDWVVLGEIRARKDRF